MSQTTTVRVRMGMSVADATVFASELLGELDERGARLLDQLWLKTALTVTRKQVPIAERAAFDARADRLLELIDPPATVEAGELRLPLGVALEPTESMKAGLSYVTQCSWCGLLAAVVGGLGDDPAPRRLGACPGCGGTTWWRQELDVGPFRKAAA